MNLKNKLLFDKRPFTITDECCGVAWECWLTELSGIDPPVPLRPPLLPILIIPLLVKAVVVLVIEIELDEGLDEEDVLDE